MAHKGRRREANSSSGLHTDSRAFDDNVWRYTTSTTPLRRRDTPLSAFREVFDFATPEQQFENRITPIRSNFKAARQLFRQVSHPIQTFTAPAVRVFQELPGICHARALRREVLHALKLTGRGSGGSKNPTYTKESKIKCR